MYKGYRYTLCLFVSLVCLLSAGCASSPPKRLDDACDIFADKKRWYKKALKAKKRWGSPIHVTMAIMHQESRFKAKAKPPRTKILWVLPGPRKSSAYGYAQAKKSTWRWYKNKSGNRRAQRDKFNDAIDFIAWYNQVSVNTLKIKPDNARALYLAYHEGHGGYSRQSYKGKAWLLEVADKVGRRASRYQTQLKQCEARLKRRRWLF